MLEHKQQTKVFNTSNYLEQIPWKQISVYLRRANKFGKKIVIPNKITVKEIMKIAQSQFSIPKQFQILYYSAQKYTYNEDSILQMTQGSIIHIHDIKKYHFKQLKLSFQEITSEGSIAKANQYTVKEDQKICNFVQRCLFQKQITLVESGRKLDQNSTFQHSQIEDGANIYYYHKQKQLNRDQFQKDFNKLFEQQQQEEIVYKPKTDQNKIQNTLTKNQQSKAQNNLFKKKQRQRSSSGQIENFQLQPNFKKKKTICLKAVKKNPEDPNYIWKRDVSFSQTKNNKKLVKALKGKKNRDNNHIKNTQNSTSEQKMTINDRVKLRQQFKKLFMSQNLGLKASQRNKSTKLSGDESYNYYQNQNKQKKASQLLSSQGVF